MINKIRKLIETLKESLVKSNILINPSVREIKMMMVEADRMLKAKGSRRQTEVQKVRFVALPDGKYYIANADEWVHDQIIKEMGIIKSENYLCGEIFSDGYTWMYKYMLFDYLNLKDPFKFSKSKQELTDLFKTTRFYQDVKPLIGEVDFE